MVASEHLEKFLFPGVLPGRRTGRDGSSSSSTGILKVSSTLNATNNINIIGSGPVSLMFKSTDYNLGIASAAGHYSSAALTGDMILRTLTNTNLILQCAANNAAIKINTSNNVLVYNNLNVSGTTQLNGLTTCMSSLNVAGNSNLNNVSCNNITLGSNGKIHTH